MRKILKKYERKFEYFREMLGKLETEINLN